MIKFGLTNLRRLKTVEPISLKPITLLVGRNSGGKSTYLRSFPLIRQSLLTRTSSPILWYGDLVDFGSFDTSLSRHAENGTMSFTFCLDDTHVQADPVYYEDYFFHPTDRQQAVGEVVVHVTIAKHSDRVRLSSISYLMPKLDISFEANFNENGFSSLVVDEQQLPTKGDGFRLTSTGGVSLVPDFRYLRDRPASQTRSPAYNLTPPLFSHLQKIIRSSITGKISNKSIDQLTARLIMAGAPTDEKIVQTANDQGKLLGRAFEQWVNQRSREYYDIRNALLAMWFPTLARAVAQNIKSIFGSTLYIGPARARSERYYRYQDLAVSEIDPDGKNFPMFLNSLSKNQMENFSEWTRSLFGYGVRVSKQSGHLSINLVNDGKETNIVDVGYGVSQILPVLGQIWWAKARTVPRPERVGLSLLAIEQPELHLHPAHQALLADALVGEALENGQTQGKMHYLVETHSETLVNRFGEFIGAGKISADDVQVVLFDSADGENTFVRTVNFDTDGILVDWPYGFFQPSMLA